MSETIDNIVIPEDWAGAGRGFFRIFHPAWEKSKDSYYRKGETIDEMTQREVDGCLNLLQIPPGSKILDVPCGRGRHSIMLALMGYRVVGIDLDRENIGFAWKRANELGIGYDISFFADDMRETKQIYEHHRNRQQSVPLFNAVINLAMSYGFHSDEENLRTMQNFRKHLRPGGMLLIHTDADPEIIRGKNYRMHEERPLIDGGTLTIKEEYNQHTKRLNGLWEVSYAGKKIGPVTYSVRLYGKTELEEMAQLCGFGLTRFSGSLSSYTPLTPDSKEMVMVATAAK